MGLAEHDRLGRFEILGPVGAGGMGEVYRALDQELKREVAIKVLPAEVATDPERVRRFETEARAAAALNHPSILAVHDVGTYEGSPYLVTELLEGETLRERIRAGGVTVAKAVEYAVPVAEGLAAAHAKGIIHRDLKTENLFLTTDGRIKILDFGLAKLIEPEGGAGESATGSVPTQSGAVLGTAGYMAPEQVRGAAADARSDIFSFGVVLYEMLCGRRPFAGATIGETMSKILNEDPPALGPPVPPALQRIVGRCLEKRPEDRFSSAHDLALALEALQALPARAAPPPAPEEARPYPGLAAFTEADAEFFFGRETEVEELWRRIPEKKLLGIIGPSGAGKSSFIRAGLVPNKPTGWGIVVCTPGNAAIASLREVLVPEMSGDTEAIQELVRVEDPDAMVSAVARWRQRWTDALIIVDQFEELFTQNAPEEQGRFVSLIGRLALRADVHVVLCLRDDFFIHTQAHDPLQPIVDALTVLLPPSGEALRRALVEPAAKSGFDFEERSLVDEMLIEVEEERGALPLLAFAVSRLWEKRDRGRKLLVRRSYEDIGGVGGALAGHAEATLASIGRQRLAIVRELFRNLVTAEGTRSVRDVDELLSVFPDDRKTAATDVLGKLVDARLLTSYELDGEGEEPRRRIEIIHESLLERWPRLVGWQTQDADSARLRDEVRQAARTWQEHDRADDLLWTGTAYREFRVWRERYPGGLTETEEAFGGAMTRYATRRRRMRRLAVAAIVAALGAGLGVVGSFWRQSVREARRAEAAELVALGQLELEAYPTAAVAHAIAGLERADSAAARRLAVEALWKGPPAMVVNDTPTAKIRFTSDGGWLVQSFLAKGEGPLRVIGVDGSTQSLSETDGDEFPIRDTATESCLFVLRHWDQEFSGNIKTKGVTLWSAAEGRRLSEAQYDVPLDRGLTLSSDAGRVTILISEEERQLSVDTLSFDGVHERLATREFDVQTDDGPWSVTMDQRTGRWVAESTGHGVYVSEIVDNGLSVPRFLGRQPEPVTHLMVDQMGRFVATADADGRIRLWDLVGISPPEVIQGPPGGGALHTPDDGSFLCSFWWPPTVNGEPGRELEYWIWSLDNERPELLRRMPVGIPAPMSWVALDPVGRHFARTGWDLKIRLWSISAPADAEPLCLLRGEVGQVFPGEFHPQGGWLAVPDHAGLALWPLARPYPAVIRIHGAAVNGLVFGPQGRWLASSSTDGTVRIWPLEGDAPPPGRVLFDAPQHDYMQGLARSPEGDRLLVGTGRSGVHLLSVGDDLPQTLPGSSGQYFSVAFSPDGRYAAAAGGQTEAALRNIAVWDVASMEQVAVFAQGELVTQYANPQFVGNGHVMAVDGTGLRRWNIESGASDLLHEGSFIRYAATPEGRQALLVEAPTSDGETQVVFLDLETGDTKSLETHGNRISTVALDESGEIVASGGPDGAIRVGPVTGEEPHLLLGHESRVTALAIDPLGRWVAAGDGEGVIRLWPMPDLSQPPLHTLPRAELIAKLNSLTNVRVVRDETSVTGWELTHDPFPGWETVPTW